MEENCNHCRIVMNALEEALNGRGRKTSLSGLVYL